MDRQNAFTGVEQAPDHAAQTDDYQRAIDQCTESDLSHLGGDVALQNIANRVEGRIIGVADEI